MTTRVTKKEDPMDVGGVIGLPMEEKLYRYTFHVITNPPMYEIKAGVSKVEWKTVEVYGTSREDAARRAGIET